ncbi:autotransporter outer membrane beta-barrel domain-containing protein [uncultured Phascolarctobacterium sp.]|uniref:autotransporter outer membrane beta-barrel domain-containing protein n=1 Tax=uncultured Phascolarctobacterium sp. TaxID=512296 RepID=UPI0025884A8C|nr:autotransporter outer membrane beta-barrel domain-containing protein [uncultured Phascolarctobacterium sp.]
MKKRETKLQVQSILATVVMGMNLVNTAAPAVAVAMTEQQEPAPKQSVSEAQQEEMQSYAYEVLPILAGYVDEMVFSKAEAASSYSVGVGENRSIASTDDYDSVYVASGGTCTIDSNRAKINVVDGGSLNIGNNIGSVTVSGGNVSVVSNNQDLRVEGGNVSVVNSEHQIYVSGGTCIIDVNKQENHVSGGTSIIKAMDTSDSMQRNQVISGGVGIVSVMNATSAYNQQVQTIHGGSGVVGTMLDGWQWIKSAGAEGHIGTMSGGSQAINAGSGSIDTMYGGVQTLGKNTNAEIATMVEGLQFIHASATGAISAMYGGQQIIGNPGYENASGAIISMAGGQQQIWADNNGSITTMSGASAMQIIGLSGTANGSIDTLEDGIQMIGYNNNPSYKGVGTGTINIMNNGLQIVGYSGGSACVGSIKTMNNGQQQVNDGGTGTVTDLLGGIQIVRSGGTATATTVGSGGMQYIEAGAVISGTVLDGGSLRLRQTDSAYTLANTLTINNGVLDLTNGAGIMPNLRVAPVYQMLTLNDLQGTGGNIYMDTDLANNTGDQIIVNSSNSGTGTYAVYVNDQSIVSDTELTGRLLLIDDQSGRLNFEGITANNGGLWDATPVLNKETNQWYLSRIVKTANNDTKVLLFDAENSYAMWRNTADSLRSRLGELHGSAEHDNGIWARTQTGRFSGSGYEGRYNLYQLGYDKIFADKSVYGAAIDYGDGTGSYAYGSGKDKLTALSLYGVWQGNRGTYTNVTARYGSFTTDLKSYGGYPDKADYKHHVYSISVEYGQRFDYQQGLFFEPQAQFTMGRINSISYTTDRGANGYIEGMNSAIGRIGVVLGQKVKNDSDIYIKADLLHEFAGERDLQLTSDAGGTNDILREHSDYGDTWFELGLGGNVRISKTGNFYGEVTRGFGGDINKKWSVNAGLRFTF